MKTLYVSTMTTALLGLALASTAFAQPLQEEFPAERTATASCDEIDWNKSMLQHHPDLIGACQEVVVVDEESWARFAARFVRIDADDNVIFSVRDKRDRIIEEVTLDPTPGQVAYIDETATPFDQLSTTDRISLYVPEGQYGFTTQPVAQEELATVVEPAEAPVEMTDRTVAQRDTTRSVLPTTAGPLPWFALVGFLSMLGALGLTVRRWN
jgi:hypothetical protein